MPISIDRQILQDVAKLAGAVEASREKIDKMFDIIVVGTPGCPPVPEVVREHSRWINEHDDLADKREARWFETQKGIVFLILGQVVAIGGSAVAVFIGLKK